MVRNATSKVSAYYTLKGDTLVRTRKMCPKCGPGVFLAEHADRRVCGKCGYVEKKEV